MGECLVGGTKIGKFLIKNDGGSGKFCFIPKQIWPVTNFKVSFGAMSECKMSSKLLHLRQFVGSLSAQTPIRKFWHYSITCM